MEIKPVRMKSTMKAKLLLVGDHFEHHVASFQTPLEAMQCGSLLRALQPEFMSHMQYVVEYRKSGKRKLIRQDVDPLVRRLPFDKEEMVKVLKDIL